MGERSLRRGSSAVQRLVEATRRHFRDYGESPSHVELAVAVGIRREGITRVLRLAAAAALLSFTPGQARSIILPRRGEMLSDTELELEAHARGATIIWPRPILGPLAEIMRVADTAPDLSLSFSDLWSQIDAAEEARHGIDGAEARDHGG